MPEVLEKPAKTKRNSWTQNDVASLVYRSTQAGFTATASEHAKLVELGLRQKPAKPMLHAGIRESADMAIADLAATDEPQRTLVIRYALKSLQALLPKRTPAK